MKSVFLFLFLFLLLPFSVQAEPQRHKVLTAYEERGGRVDFMGHAFGLDGWMITNDNGNQYVYTTPEGGLVIGMMFDNEGNLVTDKQVAATKAKLSGDQSALPGAEESGVMSAEAFYAATEKSAWVKTGKDDAPYIYMFMNVSCEHCQAMWKDLQPALEAGQVQVRLVPFGQQEANVVGGAALLSADEPGKAWTQYINGDKGVLGADKILNDMRRAMEANNEMVNKWRLAGTPFTLYRRTTDGEIIAIAGRAENIMAILADIMKR